MKILKEGKVPEHLIHFKKCENCLTEFEFYQDEVIEKNFKGKELYLWINCPLCNKQTALVEER